MQLPCRSTRHAACLSVVRDDSVAQQFVYRALLTNPGERATTARWLSVSDTSFGWPLVAARPAEQYCYRIEAYRLVDAQLFTLVEACQPVSVELTAPVFATDEEIRAALSIDRCSEPPSELTEAWCEVNRDACGATSGACEAAHYSATCAAIAPSTASLSELVANAPPPPAEVGPAPPTPQEVALAPTMMMMMSDAAQGCTASPYARGSALWPLPLLALAVRRAMRPRPKRLRHDRPCA